MQKSLAQRSLCFYMEEADMNNFNYIFFEEYKSLDRLCGQLYNMQYGITSYIEDMKHVSQNNYRNIPNWNSCLKELIRLRHIRNYLAHEEGAFEKNSCTQKDIEWIRNFYKCILNQSDPLAILQQTSTGFESHFEFHNTEQKYNYEHFPWSDIMAAIAIAVIILGIIGATILCM